MYQDGQDVEKGQGFTRMENHFLESLCKARLNGTEYAVLLAIVRKTVGWNKLTTSITCAEITKLTEIRSAAHIAHATKSLAAKQWIKKVSQRGRPTEYSLNMSAASNAQLGITLDFGIAQSGSTSNAQSGNRSNAQSGMHKRHSLKDTEKKESTRALARGRDKPDSRVRPLQDYFSERLTRKNGNEPVAFPFGQSGKHIKLALSRGIAETEYTAIIDRYFDMKRKTYKWKWFESDFEEIRAEVTQHGKRSELSIYDE